MQVRVVKSAPTRAIRDRLRCRVAFGAAVDYPVRMTELTRCSAFFAAHGPGDESTLSGLFAAAADLPVHFSELRHLQRHGVLTLDLVLQAEHQDELERGLNALRSRAAALGVTSHSGRCSSLSSDETRYVLTVLAGDAIDAVKLRSLIDTLTQHEATVESVRSLTTGMLTGLELRLCVARSTVLAKPGQPLRQQLLLSLENANLDLAVQPESLARRAKRFVVMDMDSTLIRVEVVDELARLAGAYDEVRRVTDAAMAGEMDFSESLRLRVRALAGLSFADALALGQRLPLTDGAEHFVRTLRRLGYKTALISGGFAFAAEALQQRLHLDYAYANTLEVAAGQLTGRLIGPVVDPERKAELLRTVAAEEGIAIEQTVAIGDGANDAAMLQAAGLGIAFHAKPALRSVADTTLSSGGLDRVLFFLGISAEEWAAFTPSADTTEGGKAKSGV